MVWMGQELLSLVTVGQCDLRSPGLGASDRQGAARSMLTSPLPGTGHCADWPTTTVYDPPASSWGRCRCVVAAGPSRPWKPARISPCWRP